MQIRTIKEDTKLSKRTIAAAIMILLCIPLTLAVGIFCFEDRNYYLISIIIVALSIIPFALVFESRKPQARELVIIAVLVAIAVAGRAAFFAVPQFKPVVAIVIIAGVCFGGEAGFMVGAVTGFVSNFLFGQGPWTPWQMFAFGIIGFLAGILFKKGVLPKKKLPLCIFGGVATLVIYGLIMDTASLLMFSQTATWQSLLAMYATGLPFNLIHAAATVVFLLILSKPMIEKLDRVKKKFGLLEP
ncbi:MAG: ECF transporter S component [Christensenella sp.]